jgi:hypothetical protein
MCTNSHVFDKGVAVVLMNSGANSSASTGGWTSLNLQHLVDHVIQLKSLQRCAPVTAAGTDFATGRISQSLGS